MAEGPKSFDNLNQANFSEVGMSDAQRQWMKTFGNKLLAIGFRNQLERDQAADQCEGETARLINLNQISELHSQTSLEAIKGEMRAEIGLANEGAEDIFERFPLLYEFLQNPRISCKVEFKYSTDGSTAIGLLTRVNDLPLFIEAIVWEANDSESFKGAGRKTHEGIVHLIFPEEITAVTLL